MKKLSRGAFAGQKPASAYTVVLLSLALAGVLSAQNVTSTPPAPVNNAGWSPCASYAGYVCDTTASFNTTSLNAQDDTISTLFETAFNAWNNLNNDSNNTSGTAQGWTLDNGNIQAGSPDNFTLNYSVATAQQFNAGTPTAVGNPVTQGGLTITLSIAGTLPTDPYAGGDNTALVWAQALNDNYVGNGMGGTSIVTSFDEMDIISAGCTNTPPGGIGTTANPYCGPAYPYTYANNQFYDQPFVPYQPPGATQAFFDANVYLAWIDYTTSTLTVYDGVSYGFQNYVSPEPSVWLLSASGLLVIFLIRRRRTA